MTYMTNTTCKHGHDTDTECAVDEEGRTSCCGAYSSVFMDDGTEYCKCCYGSVTGGHVTERIRCDLS